MKYTRWDDFQAVFIFRFLRQDTKTLLYRNGEKAGNTMALIWKRSSIAINPNMVYRTVIRIKAYDDLDVKCKIYNYLKNDISHNATNCGI